RSSASDRTVHPPMHGRAPSCCILFRAFRQPSPFDMRAKMGWRRVLLTPSSLLSFVAFRHCIWPAHDHSLQLTADLSQPRPRLGGLQEQAGGFAGAERL